MTDVTNAAQIEHDDIDADLRGAIQELKIETPPEARVVIDAPEKIEVKRDEAGKFAPKERQTLTLPEKTAAPATEDIAPPAPQISPTIKAPEGWKAEAKAKWDTVDPALQAEISRREREAHQALTKQDDERNFGRKIRETLNPYMATILSEGGTPEAAINELFKTALILRSPNPAVRKQALHTIAQQFSVDLGTPLQQGASNPEMEALRSQLSEVQGQLQGITQQRQLQDQQSLQGQIEEFASKPGHEHFESVKAHMGVLLEAGIAKDMEDAYSRAVYADPEIRSSLIAATTAADKRLPEQAARTERARSAAVSVTGAPGAAKLLNGSGSVGSIEDDLRAAMREHSGRV